MANHKSAQKRNRQSIKRNARNRYNRSVAKSALQKARSAAKEGSKDKDALVSKASSALAIAVRKGALHWKAAARKISRLQKQAFSKSN